MIKKIISFGLVESVSKGLNFLVLLLLPLILTVKEFGAVGIIVSIEALFSAILLFGQDRVILRYYSFEKKKNSFIFSLLTVWAGVAVLILIFSLFLISFFFRGTFFGINIFPDLIVLSIIILLNSFRLLFISIVRSQTDIKKFTIDKLIFQILKICLVFSLAFILKSSNSYIYGVFVSLAVVFFIEIYFLKDIFKAHFIKKDLKRNWSFGIPFVFHVMAGNILIYFSRFVLERNTTIENVGLYTFASNLGLSISFVFAAFIVFFEPQIYKNSNDRGKSEKWLSLFSLSTLAINAVVIISIILIVPTIIELFFDKEYSKIVPIIPIILAAISFNAIYLPSSYRLTIYEKTKFIPLATIIAGIINIVLNIILVPKFGLYGAGLATFGSFLVLSFVTFIFSIKFTPIKFKNIIGKNIFMYAVIIAFMSLFSEYEIAYLISLFILSVISIYNSFKIYTINLNG